MKTLALSALIATSLMVAPGALFLSSGAVAQQGCGPDAPPEYFRPGGFCAVLGSNNTITDRTGGPEVPPGLPVPEECPDLVAALSTTVLNSRIKVASVGMDEDWKILVDERLRVAQVVCEDE